MQSDWQSKKGAVPARQMCCADMWQLSIWGWLFQINSFPIHRLDFKPLLENIAPKLLQEPESALQHIADLIMFNDEQEEPWKGIFCCVLPQNNFTTTIMFLQCLAVRLPHEEVPRPLFRPGSNFSWVEGGPDRVRVHLQGRRHLLSILASVGQNMPGFNWKNFADAIIFPSSVISAFFSHPAPVCKSLKLRINSNFSLSSA